MNHTPRLLPRRFYHIYYRGNNRENIFIEERNYANFMRLSERFIGSIAQTYAYCSLRNHFHLLIRIKHPDEYINSAFKKKPPQQYFSNIFNVFARTINQTYRKTCALFNIPIRKLVLLTRNKLMTDFIKQKWFFPYSRDQRERFKVGDLVHEWTERYPRIFDEQDRQIAFNQPDYHFYEWLAAVLLRDSIGYLSLIEEYEFKVHKRQHEILRKIVSTDLYQLISNHKEEFGNTQVPDLFVYAPDHSDWFFCEVKGPNDMMRSSQNRFFEAIYELAKKPIYMVKFMQLE
jgi:REP element-mobilizing transposase RayT